MPEMKDLIAIFRAETEEHLTKLDNGLVELEKQPDHLELVRRLNREVHTLKGSARVFGFNEIQDIAHRIEDLFEAIGEKRAVFGSAMAESIFRGLDAIRTLLDRVVQGKEIDVDVSDLCRELEASVPGSQAVRVRKKLRKGPKKKDGRKAPAEKFPEKTPEAGEKSEDPLHAADASSPSIPVEEYIRVPLSRVDKLLYLIGEVVIYKMKSAATIARAKRLSKLSKEAQRAVAGLAEAIKKENLPQDGEVAKWLSHCDAQVQKLREQTLNFYDQVSTEAFHLDPVIDELQAKMKEIKMLPLSTIFDGFSRMVRDIASQQGKEVSLAVSGEETELDKRVMEGIKNSLIHILRNCVDHGIEGPEERVALGKERVGTIRISAFHEADNVIIAVEDDGRGMDIDQIRETALRKRLLSRYDLERMAEEEVWNIVFMNGYSTSPIVTDVSGRGMGLDIVKRDITQLKGRVVLDARKERGTKFTLVLPLTVAVIQVLLVEAGKMLFALPMLSITESVKVKRDEVSTIEGRMAISLRERTVPLVPLKEVLDLPHSAEDDQTKDHLSVVIATSFEQRVGFIVDRIIGEQEVFIKSLGRHLGKVKNVSGAIILASGEVVVVLDVVDLVAQSALRVRTATGRVTEEKGKERRILVVEDAFSTRELEKSILENHGYLVDTAVDGLDALDRMAGAAYDLVVSDIEMPRMDGFELCRTLKAKAEARDIPFVMVTALQKEEDKRRGIELGAAAYLVKSAFDQTNLLDTIERLVG